MVASGPAGRQALRVPLEAFQVEDQGQLASLGRQQVVTTLTQQPAKPSRQPKWRGRPNKSAHPMQHELCDSWAEIHLLSDMQHYYLQWLVQMPP